jgi:hypothetical protein
LIQGTPGSISFISGTKIQNFSVELKDDEIEIKNNVGFNGLSSIESRLQQTPHFLEMELDAVNVKQYARFFNKSIADSSEISKFRAVADLEQVNDTIISYGYDDNFNEIEKKSFQKITSLIILSTFKAGYLKKHGHIFSLKNGSIQRINLPQFRFSLIRSAVPVMELQYSLSESHWHYPRI